MLRSRFSSQVLLIFCENAVQRAVKVYSEVEEIEVNTDDCSANRPAALPSVSFVARRVILVKCGNRPLRSEPNVSETYNPQRKL